jgi:hypothetical protein
MRYIIYGSAILAALLIATIASGHLPRLATASNTEDNDTMNVLKLQEVIGAKGLPLRELPDEVYR